MLHYRIQIQMIWAEEGRLWRRELQQHHLAWVYRMCVLTSNNSGALSPDVSSQLVAKEQTNEPVIVSPEWSFWCIAWESKWIGMLFHLIYLSGALVSHMFSGDRSQGNLLRSVNIHHAHKEMGIVICGVKTFAVAFSVPLSDFTNVALNIAAWGVIVLFLTCKQIPLFGSMEIFQIRN